MKTGKLADAVYGRSVHKKLKNLPETIFHGAAGDDCAMFSLEAAKAAAITRQIVYAGEYCGKYGVYAAANQAAAAGCKTAALILSLMLPADAPESLLQQITEEARTAGEACGIPVADVSASVTSLVTAPVLTVTAIGTADPNSIVNSGVRVKPGMDVVMTKWAGLEGSAILADICREQLLTRYPAYLVDDAAGFDRFLSVTSEIRILSKMQAALGAEIGAVCAAAEGGIFRALWTLGVLAGTGLEIRLKKIPIRQETVEICNHLDLNPYELAAGGSLLVIASQGEALVQEFAKAGIAAAVIGTVTDNNDRVIVNGEERRFLEPAKADEIFKMTEK